MFVSTEKKMLIDCFFGLVKVGKQLTLYLIRMNGLIADKLELK